MPAQANKGAVAPQGKQEKRQQEARSSAEGSSSAKPAPPQERRGPTAVRGDIPPAGVLEDSTVADTKADKADKTDTKADKAGSAAVVQDIVLPPHTGNFAGGLKREATVLTDNLTGATVVVSDRVKSPLTLETLEVLQEPVDEDTAREQLEQAISDLDSTRHEAASKAR
jgi:hypothetical protein